MNKLNSFDSIYLQKFELAADLSLDTESSGLMTLSFEVEDPLNEIDLDGIEAQHDGQNLVRRDELWKSTCFEMFLNPPGQNKYYEFNFALDGGWNCYLFAGYRFPQPPEPSNDFTIEKWTWKLNRLEIQIKNNSPFQKFNVGLTSVIKNKKNQITYFALKHESGKPDFHVGSTFTLQRG